MPSIRGAISRSVAKVGHFDDSPAVLEFVCSESFEKLAAVGTSCPDHFCGRKFALSCWRSIRCAKQRRALSRACRPPSTATERVRGVLRALQTIQFAADARSERGRVLGAGRRHDDFANDKATARIAAEFYVNAINVMRESSLCRPIRFA